MNVQNTQDCDLCPRDLMGWAGARVSVVQQHSADFAEYLAKIQEISTIEFWASKGS